jgi:putative transposase
VDRAADYRWSSAGSHPGGPDEPGVVDLVWLQQAGRSAQWPQMLGEDNAAAGTALRRCTYAGRPFGDTKFVERMSHQFGRSWVRGRPRKSTPLVGKAFADTQLMLVEE